MLAGDLLRHSARLFGGAAAIEDFRRTVTFAELAAEVRGLARSLESRGIGPGDRVAVLSKNRIEYAALYFAAADLGAALVPLNWRLRPAEVAHILDDSGSKIVFAGPEFLETIDEVRSTLKQVIIFCSLGDSPSGWEPWAIDEPRKFDPRVSPDSVAVQMYTSGTTGDPRGAMLTHRNLRSMAASWLLEMPLKAGEDRFLQVTPLFHVGGLLMLLANVAGGSTLVLHPEFLPGPAFEALAGQGITHALLVPAMIRWLLAEPGVRDCKYPTLRMMIYGAAPMPVPLLEDAIATFGCSFLQGYGLTETTGVLTVLRPEDHRWNPGEPPPKRLASAGREVLCCEVRVVDDSGIEVEPGEVGQIVARGENIMAGYAGMPGSTEATMGDGWLKTGDLATVDEEGYVYIVDRQKDLIIVGGENVYPQEVEAALLGHPAVAEAAVVGIPHDVWGEEVFAVVVLRNGSAIGDRELIQDCRTRLARFKCPKVEFRGQLPRNSAGKVLKREIRRPYWAARERKV